MLKILYSVEATSFSKYHRGLILFMTGVEKLFIYYRGGTIWDQGGNISKFIDRGNHRGAFHRVTWTGCSYHEF